MPIANLCQWTICLWGSSTVFCLMFSGGERIWSCDYPDADACSIEQMLERADVHVHDLASETKSQIWVTFVAWDVFDELNKSVIEGQVGNLGSGSEQMLVHVLWCSTSRDNQHAKDTSLHVNRHNWCVFFEFGIVWGWMSRVVGLLEWCMDLHSGMRKHFLSQT